MSFSLPKVVPQIKINSQGFTIVEVLVVTTILGTIGYMMADIVSRSLQGSQKTNIISTAKQNGQVALDSISQIIRGSDQVVCVAGLVPNPIGTTSGDTIVLYTHEGGYVRFRYVQIGSPTRSYIAKDLPQVTFLINNLDAASSPARVCDTSAVTGVAVSNDTILTDTDSTNGVLINKVGGTGPIFSVLRRPGSSDTITIQFNVSPSNTAGGYENRLGGSGSIQFQQTVQLR